MSTRESKPNNSSLDSLLVRSNTSFIGEEGPCSVPFASHDASGIFILLLEMLATASY